MSWTTREWAGRKRLVRWRTKDRWGRYLAPRVTFSGTTWLAPGGAAYIPQGINWGTWGEQYPATDGALTAALGVDHVRTLIRSGLGASVYTEGGDVDAYENNGTNYFRATHSARFIEEIDAVIAAGMSCIVAYDTDSGQGVRGMHANATGWNFFDGSPEAAEATEKFYKGWEWIATQCRGKQNILAYELLPEPMPYDSIASDAPLLVTFYTNLMNRIRAIDPNTPFLIGPRASYGPNNIDEVLFAGRTDCIYTIDVLTNRVSSEGTIAALIKGFRDWLVANNKPGIIQQLGRRSIEDIGDINADAVADTTENIGLTALNGALFVCKAFGVPITLWQMRQNTTSDAEYALYVKNIPNPTGPSDWHPKPAEIASFTYHNGLDRTGLVTAAEAAATAMGSDLFRIKSDLSNVFQDAAGTIPVTAVGQPIGRWNAVVGTRYWQQTSAAARPTLTTTDTGEYAITCATGQFMDFSDVARLPTGSNAAVTIAARAAAGSAARVLLHVGTTTSIPRGPYIAVLATDELQASWRGDDNVGQNLNSVTLCDDRSIVCTARRVTTDTKTCRLNGVQEGVTNTTPVGGIATINRFRLGSNSTGGNSFTGPIALVNVSIGGTDEQVRHIERLGAWSVGAPFRGAIPA